MRPLTAKRARLIGGAAAFCLLLAGQAAAVQAAGPRSQVSPGAVSEPLLRWPQAIPTPGLGSQLNGVFCISATNCWAVGNYVSSGFGTKGAILNQALHWNGSTWSQAATPEPGGTATGNFNGLFGVWCTLAANCWAVGLANPGSGAAGLNQALHWNGRAWSQVATPDPAGTANGDVSALVGVRCRSSGTCLAVGTYKKGGGTSPILNQALRWNGRKWSTLPVPDPAGRGVAAENELSGLSCTSATNCWAVGFTSQGNGTAPVLNQALHWNGRKWSPASIPDPGGRGTTSISDLLGAYCTSARNCWAVGEYGTNTGVGLTVVNQVLRWNGRRWANAVVPDPGGRGTGAKNTLTDVTCTTGGNCWAVGHYVPSRGTRATLNEVLHWNGHTWRFVISPDPGGISDGDISSLLGARCASSALCWAVGEQEPSGQHIVNEALRWNGHHWLVG